jgi:SAM-dependent methyltransferase
MTTPAGVTWEEAVRWYRAQPGNETAVRANYFDLPVRAAAERFAASEEFVEAQRWLGAGNARALLDLGAGNGIASYAFARAGWKVTALEPDPSSEMGFGAIRALAREANLPIEVLTTSADLARLPAGQFAAVFARQVLHHVPSLAETMSELFRVLAPGGLVLATREHVVHDDAELKRFLAEHPLHPLYGGENAHTLEEYLAAAQGMGFRVAQVWGPLQSILNFFPGTEAERKSACRWIARWRWFGLGHLLMGFPGFVDAAVVAATNRDSRPGRIYSFLLAKP